MKCPDTIDARWIDSLTDADLRSAERTLRARLDTEESAEKKKRGSAYHLLRGPEALTTAWLRWSLVRNATRARGIRVATS